MNKTKQKSNTSSFFGKVHEYLQSDFFDEEEKLHTSRKAKLYTFLFVLVIILIVVGSLIIYELRYFCEQQKIIVERMQRRHGGINTFLEEEARNDYYDYNCNLYFGNPEGVHDPR